MVTKSSRADKGHLRTYSIILLIEIVDIAIQYFNKELNRYGRIHACICNT